MSQLVAQQATPLGAAVIEHLDEQISSGRRLLAAILAQGKAIREQDVETVVQKLADIKTEMDLRQRLDMVRSAILEAAGQSLGIPAPAVTLEALVTLVGPLEAASARERSAELRGLLDEIAREHGINRALMRQELAFLDHLIRLVGGEPEGALHARRRLRPRPAARPPPRPERAGLAMTQISTFIGLQQTAPRDPGAPARDRDHGPEHREREHRGLLAPADQPERRDALRRRGRPAGRRRRRPARRRRRRSCRSSGSATASSTSSTAPRTCRQGNYDTTASGLDQVEQGFQEPSDNGISKLARQLLVGLAERRQQPRERRARARRSIDQAQERSPAAINELQNRITDITTQTSQQYTGLTGATGDVQGYANELGKLNNAIKDAVAGGDTPNDLLDRRDLLLDKLSNLAQVSTVDNGNGTITVNFGDAANPLVQGNGTVNWPQTLTQPGRQARRADRPHEDRRHARPATERPERRRQDASPTASTRCTTRAAPAPTSSTTPRATRPASLSVGVTAATVNYTSGTGSGGNDIATCDRQPAQRHRRPELPVARRRGSAAT